jgi:hypothetical protein
MTLVIVLTVGLSLERLKMTERSCETCLCVDSEENPIFEVLREDGEVDSYICMMCYVEELEEEEYA